MSWERYTGILLRFRGLVTLLLLGLVSVSGWLIPRLEFDLTIGPLLQASAAQREAVNAYYGAFEPRIVDVICIVEWPRQMRALELDQLERIADATHARSDVSAVVSVANVRVAGSRAGFPVPVPFAGEVGDGEVREAAARHPLIEGRLLSRDGRSAALHVVATPEGRAGLTERLETFVPQQAGSDLTVRFVGPHLITRAMTTHMRRDMWRAVWLEVLILLVVLPLLLRSLRGSVLPIAVVLSAVALNFGFCVALGLQISLIGLAIPGLITVIGLCDTVHMMERFEESLAGGADKLTAIREMMTHVGTACFYTSFTTALGFGSLLAADHSAVQHFGAKAAAAVLITFLTVIVLLPIGLSFWPVRGPARLAGSFTRRLTYGRRWLTIAVFAAIVGASVLGAQRIVVDSKWLEELPRGDPAVRDLQWYEANFNGYQPLEVRLDGDLASPETFRALEQLQARMIGHDGVTGCESYTQWVRELLGNPPEATDGQIRTGIGFLRLAKELFPADLLHRDMQRGRVIFRTTDIGTRRYLALRDELERAAAELPDGVRAEVAGYSLMAHESSRLVVTTMLRSFVVSLITICLFITLIYRSVRIGLISVVPNVLPIMVALGVSGWAGIPLRIGIVMIYCLGLGLAVDDSIHLITRYVQERRARSDASVRECLNASLRSAGHALVVTSIILIIGALCYLPSEFASMNDVGILLTAIVCAALLGDLFLLPVLIEWFGPRRD